MAEPLTVKVEVTHFLAVEVDLSAHIERFDRDWESVLDEHDDVREALVTFVEEGVASYLSPPGLSPFAAKAGVRVLGEEHDVHFRLPSDLVEAVRERFVKEGM